jgi:NADP-dependent 3-hydroxy acid dehydrogenase YdfG
MELLQNKNVLVAGATGGIGSELIKLLVSSKAVVFLTGRNQEKLSSIAEQNGIPSERVFLMDVTNASRVNEVAASIHQQVEQLDIMINATGIGILKSIEDLSYEDFDRSVDVNLKGAFYLLKAFLPPMKKVKKGLVIHLPGVLGKAPMNGAGAYAATKYGLNGLTKSVREELRRTDIRITNIYLGGVDSPFWDTIDMRVKRDKMITAKDAARAVWFLCQQPASGVVSEMVLQPFNHQVL